MGQWYHSVPCCFLPKYTQCYLPLTLGWAELEHITCQWPQQSSTHSGQSWYIYCQQCGFSLYAHFYSPSSSIIEIYTKDLRTWKTGSLTQHAFNGLPSSNLAAYLQSCGSQDCLNGIVIVYQAPNRYLRTTTSRNVVENITFASPSEVGEKTGIAIVQFQNRSSTIWDMLQVYAESNNVLHAFTGKGAIPKWKDGIAPVSKMRYTN